MENKVDKVASAVTRPVSIIVVDDEELIGKAVTQALELFGYQVGCFSSAEDALRVFEQAPSEFDVVISDYTMPCMDGLELIRRMRSKKQTLLTIIMTGALDQWDEQTSKRRGVDGFFGKPFKPSELVAFLKQALRPEQV